MFVHAPGERISLPPDSSSREAAVWAMMIGVRSRTIWVQPMFIRVVDWMKAVRAVTESRINSTVSEKNPIS